MQRQMDIQILIKMEIYFWLLRPCVCVCIYIYCQVDRAHVRAAERERQLAALATAQVRPPPRYFKYTGTLQMHTARRL